MAKPLLVVVDDDPNVLRVIERDLRHAYGNHYRILHAESGARALEALQEVQRRNETVALLLVDQRMPEMSGIEFLGQAMKLFPDAKRVLLTAYADTDAAIQAINTAHIHYYLLKPWDPPEEHLYPVLNDLLDDWKASFRPAFEGMRLIGYRWSPATHQIKDFLARNQVSYRWLDIEQNREARQLVTDSGSELSQLPLVILPDGVRLAAPTNEELAEHVGLKTRADIPFYDLVIVGAAAGLAAAVYGASEGLRTVLIERDVPGGQAGTSARIDNYLGFPAGLSGADLTRRAVTQARRFGVEIVAPQEVVKICCNDPYRMVYLTNGTELSCHVVLLATGVTYRKLDVPGLDRLTGAGVYYGAALAEAISCRDEPVCIVGGANSAGQAAVYFAQFAKNVTLLLRGESLADGMSHYLIEQIERMDTINVLTQTEVAEVHGEEHLEAVTIVNHRTHEAQTLTTHALCVFIGAEPHTEWLAGTIARDEEGFILSGPDVLCDGRPPQGWTHKRDPFFLETSIAGIFVAGDVRHGSVKRVASAVGEGAMAVQFIHQYLSMV